MSWDMFHMFVDIIKVFIATDNDQQSYQRLTQTCVSADGGHFEHIM